MPERQFILSCESTVDLPYAYVTGRDIPILFYSYMIDGETFIDDMGRDPESIPAFYRKLDAGALPTTAQLNEVQYEEFLAPLLQRGDVLHIVFGTGMTSSYQSALLAAKTLREQYPDRKLVVIDSLCSSSGYGMLVDDAADLRDRGASLEETAAPRRSDGEALGYSQHIPCFVRKSLVTQGFFVFSGFLRPSSAIICLTAPIIFDKI